MKKIIIKDRKDLCYTIGKDNKPKLKIDPGETVFVETEDAMSGQIRKKDDRRDYKKIPGANPNSGPIYINNAEPGDTLIVEIKDIKPRIGQASIFIWPGWFLYLGHVPTDITMSDFLKVKIPEKVRILKIKDGKVYFDKMALPYNPMIGTIGTAPSTDAVSTFLPGPHGGNMDIPCITTGATLYLPVMVKGALLHLGDVHAVQGDAELCGQAAEMPAEVTVKIDLIKNKSIDWPRVENKDYIMTLACQGPGRSLDDTIRLAYVYLVRWMEEYGIEQWDAWELLTLLGKVQLGGIWSVATGFPKKYLHYKKE